MHIEKENLRQVVVAIPARLYHGAPAILLGIILNMLDAGESSTSALYLSVVHTLCSLYWVIGVPVNARRFYLHQPPSSSHVALSNEVSQYIL